MNREYAAGRVTIPTDVDIVRETLEVMKRWGADAIRDCDGTEFPAALRESGAKIYATYYTTRKDNAWAKAHPEEVQQCYIMTAFHTAYGGELRIRLLDGFSEEMLQVNHRDDIVRWWEVIDRTTGQIVDPSQWAYRPERAEVVLLQPVPYHEYTVSFLAYLIWDPVHMYNAVVNDWKDVEKQITFDVRQPKTRAFSLQRLRRFLEEHNEVDVVRFTTFFHQFTLVFDELRREKYVDWYGYSASVSPYILEQFEQECGYPFRPEYIVDQGYYNNQYRVPTREYRDFMAYQRREVASLAKEMVDIVHEYGKEAMMFLGDHWIGTEPYLPEFASIGLDAVVGSVGNGSTLRLISDIGGVRYTEGRFLPYFFPDTFHPGGEPVREARENWLSARRAILRRPIDRVGYGGYLKLAISFPGFVEYIEGVCEEFRTLYDNVRGAAPWCACTVAVLNCWGASRAWGCHMVHHALYHKQNTAYAGVMEALAGAALDVRFISFEDILADPETLDGVDVLLNVGGEGTAHSGGAYWGDVRVLESVRGFIAGGGGFIGVGEPTALQREGRLFQLAEALGVEQERGFTLGYDKYNWRQHPHFILEDCGVEVEFGEGGRNVYALPGAQVLVQRAEEVHLAANGYADGRCVYISGLPYSFENTRLLYRAVLWACGRDVALRRWYSANPNTEVHAYPQNGRYCVVNNTCESRITTVYRGDGSDFRLELLPGEIKWYTI